MAARTIYNCSSPESWGYQILHAVDTQWIKILKIGIYVGMKCDQLWDKDHSSYAITFQATAKKTELGSVWALLQTPKVWEMQ